MNQLSKHLYVETQYDWANVGAAVTEEGVVLIDCPVRPTDSKHWQNEIRNQSPKGIRFLIATDYHGDHTSGASFIKGDISFIAPQHVYEQISKGNNIFSKEAFVKALRDQGRADEADELAQTPVPLPRFCFEQSLILHLPPLTFEVRRLGGHSPACSIVYIPEEKVLFGSDVVLNSGMRDANFGEWIRALEWVESLPVDTIVPGHGELCGKEVPKMIRERLTAIREAMKDLTQKGLTKAEAVVDASFDRFFHADASRGQYWLQQRKETFRAGLENVFDEVTDEQES